MKEKEKLYDPKVMYFCNNKKTPKLGKIYEEKQIN